MIQINRHNYEPFFLSYIDNELSIAEREAVELFVEQNADLKAEFEALKQSVLQPDLVNLENKEALLKKESLTSITQDLLLLLDKEVNDSQKKNTEELINNDFAIAKEWEILQQTKLVPDTSLVFPNKEVLYKKEATLISMYWKRIAIAAILLGFGFWAGFKYYSNSTEEDNIQLANGVIPKQNKNIENTHNNSSAINVVHNSDNKKNNTPVLNHSQNQLVVNKKQEAAGSRQKLMNNYQPAPYLGNINKQESNKIAMVAVLPETNQLKLAANGTPSIKSTLIKENITGAENSMYAANTVYIESDEEPNDNKFFYVSEEKLKRTKLGGLFRKVKQVFERTADLKTSEGIKIAGFEIAIK